MITHLKALAFQGRDLSLTLEPANVITGDPFSGKTSLAYAIRLMMYGHVSALGKDHASTFKLCSNDKELFVRGVFKDNRSNQVVINRDSEGAFSKSEDLQVKFPVALMDVDDYFGLTGQKRLAYVLDRVDPVKAGYDEKALLKDLQNVDDVDKTDWVDQIALSIQQRNKTKSSVVLWMDSLLQRLKTGEKVCKQTIKTCETTLSEWKKVKTPQDVSAERDKAQRALINANAKLGVVENEEEKKLLESIDHTRKMLQSSRAAIGELELEEFKMLKLTHCPTCLSEGKDWLKKWQERNQGTKKNYVVALRDWEKDLAKLEGLLEKSRAKFDKSKQTAKILREIAEAQIVFDELDAQNSEFLAYERNRKDAESAQTRLVDAQAEQQVLKHMVSQLVKHQQTMVESVFNSLLKVARAFTDGILNSSLEYRDGELGRRFSRLDEAQGKQAKFGSWISHEAFSGTERLLAYGGLQVALSQDAPFKIVISDELGRMPTHYIEIVATRMLDLLRRGVISQWIGIACQDDWITSKLKSQLNVIKMK